jgi:hypothetical protein
MILDQLFEAAGQDSTARQIAQMLQKTHPNPSAATEREILAATSRVLTAQGMSDVQVRFYLRDPDFQSDIIEAVQAQLQGVAEAMKPSDIPPTMRDRLTMRDIEKERPQGAFRFRVTFPDGAYSDFMDFGAAQQSAAVGRGRISKINENIKKKIDERAAPTKIGDDLFNLAAESVRRGVLETLRDRFPATDDISVVGKFLKEMHNKKGFTNA